MRDPKEIAERRRQVRTARLEAVLEILGLAALVAAGWLVYFPLGLAILGLGLLLRANARTFVDFLTVRRSMRHE